jgi:hypothetical protein
MRRALLSLLVLALITVAFAAGGYAAGKSYQFTGVVKAVDASSMTVEKSAKETWQFDLRRTPRGPPRSATRSRLLHDVGDAD